MSKSQRAHGDCAFSCYRPSILALLNIQNYLFSFFFDYFQFSMTFFLNTIFHLSFNIRIIYREKKVYLAFNYLIPNPWHQNQIFNKNLNSNQPWHIFSKIDLCFFMDSQTRVTGNYSSCFYNHILFDILISSAFYLNSMPVSLISGLLPGFSPKLYAPIESEPMLYWFLSGVIISDFPIDKIDSSTFSVAARESCSFLNWRISVKWKKKCSF